MTSKKSALHSDNEFKYKFILDQSFDGVMIYNAQLQILEFNEKAHNLLGYSEAEFSLLNLSDLFFENDLEKQPIAVNMLTIGKPIHDKRRLKKKDGEMVDMELTSTLLPDGTYMAFGRDITQKKKLHLREKARAQILEKLAKGKPFHSILKQIVLSAEIYEPGLVGSIMLVDIERRKFTRGAAPSLPEYFIEAVESVYIQEGAGSCGTAAYLGKRIIVEDVATHPYFEGYGPLCEQVGIKSSWSEPILDPSGKVIGTFAFYRNRIATPSQEDLNYIKELNDICSIVFNKFYSEARFKALVENSSDGIAIISADGKVKYITPSIFQILGYNKEEVSDYNIFNFVHNDDKPVALNSFEEVLKNPGVPIQGNLFRMRHKNGSWRFMERTTNNLIDTPGINGLVVNFRDVTEKMFIKNSMISEKQLFDYLINNMSDVVFYMFEPNGKFIRWNKTFEELSGYTAEEIGNLSPYEFYEGDQRVWLKERLSLVMEGAQPSVQVEIISKNKQKVQLVLNSRYFKSDAHEYIMGVGFDVSKRLAQENAIKKSNERFEYAVEATNDFIWEFDLETNELNWSNNYFKFFGFEINDPSTNYNEWTKNIHPEDASFVINSLNSVLDGNDKYWDVEYRYLKANHEYAFVHDKGIVIRDESGKAVKMVGAMQDITASKLEQEKMARLNKELEKRAIELHHSNKELERFAYVASHDLQEPLRMVTGFLGLLEKNYKSLLDETAGRYIHFATDGAERMKGLIHDLLEYSRVSTNMDPVGDTNLNDILNEIRETFVLKCEELGAVIKGDHLPTMSHTRRTLIFQLMQNLIGNALKYSADRPPVIEVSASEQDDCWQVSVKDNGIGIKPDFFEKIFVIFQRLHNRDQYSGTGIGLSICKKIVELHGGKIWLESTPGEGTTFYFTIKK